MHKTQIILNKSNLINNINVIKKYSSNCSLIPIIKSNAYGHGQIEIAKILDKLDIFALGVAYPEEAIYLKKNDINTKILIVVPISIEDCFKIVNFDIIPSIDRIEVLRELNKLAKEYDKVIDYHLFLNTGMNRDGLSFAELNEYKNEILSFKNVNLVAFMSHYAISEDDDFSSKQKSQFLKMTDGFNVKKHISNSGGVFYQDNIDMDYVRPGLSIYGILPDKAKADELGLKPVLKLKSNIINIFNVKKGEYVGYSFKYQAQKDMKVAVLPFGYGDGYSYHFSNNSKCIINDEFAPIISSICMDLTICDVTEIDCKIGDEVILIGESHTKEINANELASNINTIPYEILTSLKAKIEKVVV